MISPMIRFALVLTLLLGGCWQPGKKHHDRTPAGWEVKWEEQGTISTGLHTREQLYSLFDAAMVRGCAESDATMKLPAGTSMSRAKRYETLYTLVDNAWFPVGDGFAAGCVYGRHNLSVAFYSLKSVPNGTPIIAPPWTLHQGIAHPDQTFYGEEVDGEQYPALGHELAHMNGLWD